MANTVEKISSNKVKITFTVPAEEFEQAIQKAYLKARGQIMVPGWRKGKAPRKVIEKMYGAGIFYEDALDLVFPDAYEAAIQENDLKIVAQAELDNIEQMEAGKDLIFSCQVFVYPEFELGEYKGLEVERQIRKITPEEVDARIEHERTHLARTIEVTDRPLENGDTAELDYSGTVDGVKFEGGTAENQTLKIGSGSFIPGFEEQMIGMTIGTEKDLNVKFPEEYHAEDLKGKDAVFHVKLNGITREELPEVDDDFASEISEFDTLAEYRADLEKHMQESNDREATDHARNSLIQKVVENTEIDLPDPMVEKKLDEMMEEMDWNMHRQGFSLEQYMKILGQDMDQIRNMYREQAKNSLKADLILEKVIETEKVEATDEDVDRILEEYASASNKTLDQVKESFGEDQLAYFKHSACITKAMDLLWDSAKVTDVEAKDEPVEDSEEADEAAEESNN